LGIILVDATLSRLSSYSDAISPIKNNHFLRCFVMDTQKRRRLITLGLVLAVICVSGFISMGMLDHWIDDVFYRDVGMVRDAILKVSFEIL